MTPDQEVEELDDNINRFDINVVFNHIRVTQGLIRESIFFIGNCGGEVCVEFTGGSIKQCTEGKPIYAEHKI